MTRASRRWRIGNLAEKSATLPIALATLFFASFARADNATRFGSGPEDAGLARADVASPSALAASRVNPAMASLPGLRFSLAYAYSGMRLTFDGQPIAVDAASGIDLAAQYGAKLGDKLDLGLALAAHLPDTSLARVSFRPATEPQFVLFEAPLQRATFDLVGAARYGAFAVGAGVAVGLSVEGSIDFRLTQDAHGANAGASLDSRLPYRFAPIAGVRFAPSSAPIAIGLTFRGPIAIDLAQTSDDRVDLTGNPLNGTTRIVVKGTAGYDPATIALGARATAGALSAALSFEYALYRFTPPPVADVTLDVNLGTTPSLREARFVLPRFRDTLSPRLGVALRPRTVGDDGAPSWRFAVRAGVAYVPTPVPSQRGFTTYLDANRVVSALGASLRLGRAVGVDWSLHASGQAHVLMTRSETKADPSLPYAVYSAGGQVFSGSGAIEASFR